VAKSAAKNTVTSKSIKDGAVKTADLGLGAVGGAQVLDGSLTGADVNESSLGVVPNATALGGLPATAYARSTVYKTEAPTDTGTALGDGTFSKTFGCNPGDLLLSGGPASVAKTSWVVDSFPTPGGTTSWTTRINPNGVSDPFTVVLLCLDQA